MKKLALAAALAATVSSGANAVAVSSNITDVQLWIGTSNSVPAGNAGGIAIGGDTDTGLTFSGQIDFVAGPAVRLTFDLSDGARQGAGGVDGTIFSSGTILIETDTGSGYTEYSTVDASVTALEFLANQDGHLAPAPTQTTAGLVVDDAGNGSFATWNGAFLDPSWNGAASAVTLFGNTAGLFLEGTVSANPVPVPAAAWLFGSALIGLAGVGRKRK